MAQPNIQGMNNAAAGGTARFNQPNRNAMSNQQGSRTLASPNVAEPMASAEHNEGAAAGDAGKSGSKRIIEPKKQELGDKLYEKIHKLEPALAGKLTGMIIMMEEPFVRKCVDNEADLKKAVS